MTFPSLAQARLSLPCNAGTRDADCEADDDGAFRSSCSVRAAVRLKSFGERFQPGDVRWSDVRASGRFGIGYAGCALASVALGSYSWVFRPVGCSGPDMHDPRVSCPSGGHAIAVWVPIAVTVVIAALVGLRAIRTGNKRLLMVLFFPQLAVAGFLIWVAQEPSYHVHLI